ncbi:MAG: RDD family protein [Burkholderiales bacterium]
MQDSPPPASLRRRLASLLYEALLLATVLWAAGVVFTLIAHDANSSWLRALLRIFLLLVAFGYFAWCWMRGGQTLAMKTWKLRVTGVNGAPLSLKQTFIRFVLACAGISLAGCGLLWALIDRDRQFLHDRLAGTKIVRGEGLGVRSKE